MKSRYKIFRFILYPLIYLANFIQNNFSDFFTPMNMGSVSEKSYADFIKKNFNKNDYVLDFGSGAGFHSTLFDKNKYLGVEINKNFVLTSRKKYKNFKFKELNKKCLSGYEKKITSIFINNVLHHLTDRQIEDTFIFFKKNLRSNTKLFIIEPLLPYTFFSLEFVMKVLDIGDNIKTKDGYLKIIKNCFSVKKTRVRNHRLSHALVLNGFLK